MHCVAPFYCHRWRPFAAFDQRADLLPWAARDPIATQILKAMTIPESDDVREDPQLIPPDRHMLVASEDWLAVWIGGALLALFLAVVLIFANFTESAEIPNPLNGLFAQPDPWSDSPLASVYGEGPVVAGIAGAFMLLALSLTLGRRAGGHSSVRFLGSFTLLFLLACLAFVLSEQEVVQHYNLEYALWALVVGLLISNTVGTPSFLAPATCTEFYIKTGLVLLGAEVLLSRLLALGIPGIFVAWIVTPIVLITTFWFGQRVLKIESPTLNMVISADMSVCGVSAAIATAAACRAKKEELSLAIGMSLTFTVIMMVVMPAIIREVGMNQVLAGAWLGGTIDATGAVAAAGALVGPQALEVAATVKMIQNILIGVVAFGVAVYWVRYMDPAHDIKRPGVSEIWHRFPKFILGFVGASLVFSLISSSTAQGADVVDTVISSSKTIRNWLFCLAFVSIGLETNFRRLAAQLGRGKPLLLYLAGQTLNVLLTLLMAWLMFEKVFPQASKVLAE